MTTPAQAPTLRFLPAGADALLVETGQLASALALLNHLQDAPPLGLLEMVPAARTVLLRYDPFLTDAVALEARVRLLDLSAPLSASGQEIEIPVFYEGEDLGDVAALLGISVPALIEKHEAATFTAAFTGFAPGFAYLTCSDPELAVPRRASPRVKVPAGSVAMAGEFGAVYPSDSPGGWQILGRTPLPMWDLDRPRPALIAPGDRVRFRDIAKGASYSLPPPSAKAAPKAEGPIRITRSDRPALPQDLGRMGQAAQGISRAGAMDRGAFLDLNRLLGNPRHTPALEISYGGFALTSDVPLTLALSGAPCKITITTRDGQKITAPHGQAFALDQGESLTLAAPSSGIYSYLGLRGGFDIPPVMGSTSYDSLAKLGPTPLGAGSYLRPAGCPAKAISALTAHAPLPRAGDLVTLDVILGPRTDWFTPEAVALFASQDWLVTPDSSRTGKRLTGPSPLERCITSELPSEATVAGSIQVPAAGQPVLFLADHPLTGGYPVIGVVAAHHLDLAAQIPPGARIRFVPISSPPEKG